MPQNREQRSKYVADWRRRMKAAGLCNRCGQRPARLAGSSCEVCFAKQHQAYLASKADGTHLVLARQSAGRCPGCGGTPEAGHASCGPCREHRRSLRMVRHVRGPRYAAMERDGFRCQVCGSTRSLVPHHRNGQGDTSGAPDDRLENLVTLCNRCHSPLTYLRRSGVDRGLAVSLLIE